METLLKKMNFKEETYSVAGNCPEYLRSALHGIPLYISSHEEIKVLPQIDFCIVFVTKKEEVEAWVPAVLEKVGDDGKVWFCYPKKTSSLYTGEIHRDKGWEIFGNYEYEPVRQVAVDEDWSALRFRKLAYIGKITRSEKMMLSGKLKP